MTLISGKDGQVLSDDAPLADITKWTFKTAARNVNYASSVTGGYRRQLPGAKEGRGHFQFLLNTADAINGQLSEGDVVVLKLHIDDVNFYTVPAIVDSIELDVNVAEGSPISGAADFSSDGAWTAPSYA